MISVVIVTRAGEVSCCISHGIYNSDREARDEITGVIVRSTDCEPEDIQDEVDCISDGEFNMVSPCGEFEFDIYWLTF